MLSIHPAPRQVSSSRPVSVIERMTCILDAFDRGTPVWTLPALVQHTGLPRSTTHRILEQLVRLRWLHHTPGGYRLGLRVLELGGLAAEHNELRGALAPVVAELAADTGAVAQLGVLDGSDVLCLDRSGGRGATAGDGALGRRVPAGSATLGKALLAALEPHEVSEVLGRDATGDQLARGIAGRQLFRELARIRGRRGVVIERSENLENTWDMALAVRCSGGVVTGFSLHGKASVDTEAGIRLLRRAAREATRRLAQCELGSV